MAEVPSAAPVASALVAHGVFLAGCGCYGAAAAGWTPKVMHSAYAGLGSCAALSLCALLSAGGTRWRYMVGVHVGLLLQTLLTGVFAVQSFRSFGVPEKQDRFPLFVVMTLGSAGALAAMFLLKPKKKKAATA
ncbi:hypothetical protein AB1Y20_018061 [Prymnesium parvum]|uniref:Uncharacterized protein n=1 Tax=Prymnesium parvum TaxID=97485 RepID=A0AB34JR01_PRYPA